MSVHRFWDPINFLMVQKFPDWWDLYSAPRPGGPQLTYAEREARLKAVHAYERHLRNLPPDELAALYHAEQEAVERVLAEHYERKDRLAFFSLRAADYDLDHWSRLSLWTLDEAVALTFGKSPKIVNWERIKPGIELSPFATRYAKLFGQAERAKFAGLLTDPVPPGVFLAWAKRAGVAYPKELEDTVAANGQSIADWQTAYDALKADHERTIQLRDAIVAERDAEIAELRAQIAHAAREKEAAEKPLAAKERDSLLKLVIGMAVDGYGYNPTDTRSPIPGQIAGHLHVLGISISDDTVRKWLNEAAVHLPQERPKTRDR